MAQISVSLVLFDFGKSIVWIESMPLRLKNSANELGS